MTPRASWPNRARIRRRRMATPLSSASVRWGTTAVMDYAGAGDSGDWHEYNVHFSRDMPPDAAGRIRVVASACDRGVPDGSHLVAPVPVVGQISPRGFTTWSRN